MTGGGGAAVAVRRNVAALDGAAIDRLRRAFQVLRDRSAQDPRRPTGLVGQANIHRDRCSHATWWFLPWHRAYLHAFEAVLREAAGDPGLTLPYWDWSTSPRLPEAFWGQDNPLNDPTREITPASAADAAFAGRTVVERILGIADFFTFASGRSADPLAPVAFGALEGTPHNYIHRFVGGRAGNMGDPARAARDPIFWLHHANVDRLWAEWTARHPDAPPADSAWLEQSFTFFDPRGRTILISTAQTLDTRRLGYEYDTQPAPRAGGRAVTGRTGRTGTPGGPSEPQRAAPEPETPMRAEAPPERPAIGRRPVTLDLGPSDALLPAREAPPGQPPAGGAPAGTVRLQVEGVAPEGNPDVGVRVFLNLPEADATTPVSDPHYVTTFTFFEHAPPPGQAGHEEHAGDAGHGTDAAHGGPKTFYADLGPVLRELEGAGLYRPGESLRVTMVTVPIDPERGEQRDVEIPFRAISIVMPR